MAMVNPAVCPPAADAGKKLIWTMSANGMTRNRKATARPGIRRRYLEYRERRSSRLRPVSGRALCRVVVSLTVDYVFHSYVFVDADFVYDDRVLRLPADFDLGAYGPDGRDFFRWLGNLEFLSVLRL